MEKEIWKPAPKYKNLEVSNFGRARSVRPGRATQIRKLGVSDSGYFTIMVYPAQGTGKKQGGKTLHTIITEVFHGERPEGMVASFRDGDKKNCYADNLYWTLPSKSIIRGRRKSRILQDEWYNPYKTKAEVRDPDGKITIYPSVSHAVRAMEFEPVRVQRTIEKTGVYMSPTGWSIAHVENTEIESLENEVWVSMPEYRRVEVSNIGRVRVVDDKKIKIISPRAGESKFLKVGLIDDQSGKKVTRFLHVLIATAFHGAHPARTPLKFRDDNPKNCSADNLYWAPRKKTPTVVKTPNPKSMGGRATEARSPDGDWKVHPNIHQAVKAAGVSYNAVVRVLEKGGIYKSETGWLIKLEVK